MRTLFNGVVERVLGVPVSYCCAGGGCRRRAACVVPLGMSGGVPVVEFLCRRHTRKAVA